MDGSRFDDLARSLAHRGTRRRFLGGLLGLGAAALGGGLPGRGLPLPGGHLGLQLDQRPGLRGLPARPGPRDRLPLPLRGDRARAGRRGLPLPGRAGGHEGRAGVPPVPRRRRLPDPRLLPRRRLRGRGLHGRGDGRLRDRPEPLRGLRVDLPRRRQRHADVRGRHLRGRLRRRVLRGGRGVPSPPAVRRGLRGEQPMRLGGLRLPPPGLRRRRAMRDRCHRRRRVRGGGNRPHPGHRGAGVRLLHRLDQLLLQGVPLSGGAGLPPERPAVPGTRPAGLGCPDAGAAESPASGRGTGRRRPRPGPAARSPPPGTDVKIPGSHPDSPPASRRQ